MAIPGGQLSGRIQDRPGPAGLADADACAHRGLVLTGLCVAVGLGHAQTLHVCWQGRRHEIRFQSPRRLFRRGALLLSFDGRSSGSEEGSDPLVTAPHVPARAAAGRRGQNVRYIPAVWQRPTSGHVRPPSKHVPSFHLVLSFRETRARESLSLSQAIGSRNNMLLRSDGCFPSGRAGAARPGEWWC